LNNDEHIQFLKYQDVETGKDTFKSKRIKKTIQLLGIVIEKLIFCCSKTPLNKYSKELKEIDNFIFHIKTKNNKKSRKKLLDQIKLPQIENINQ